MQNTLSSIISCAVYWQVGHLSELTGNTQQAIQFLEIVIASTMHDAGVLALLGALFTKCNDEAKALYYYNESHRVHPVNMDIITFLGAFYVQQELYEKAIPIFNLASKIQPNEVLNHTISWSSLKYLLLGVIFSSLYIYSCVYVFVYLHIRMCICMLHICIHTYGYTYTQILIIYAYMWSLKCLSFIIYIICMHHCNLHP